MRLGLVGLGKMGGNMVERLVRSGYQPVVFDVDGEALTRAIDCGAEGARSVADIAGRLDPPRTVWVMLPHGDPTRSTVYELLDHLAPGDLVVDGGNSRWLDSMETAARCNLRSVQFLDVGMSGGVWGLEEGYCLMVGGPQDAFERLEPVLADLAPRDGYALVGPNGAGHFVKMIHNAIEYVMLEAIGEGFEALESSDFDLDLGQIAALWGHGAVIRSWLLQLLCRAFEEEGGGLDRIAPIIQDSGTGRWTVEYALEAGVPASAVALALFERFESRRDARFSHRVIAALRHQFGGHAVRREGHDDA